MYAFDSVHWEFLNSIVQQMGLGQNGGAGLMGVLKLLEYPY